MEDICNAPSAEMDMGEEWDENVEEKQPVLTFGEAVAGYKMVQWYCPFPIDDATVHQLIQMERELIFIC